MRRRPGRRETTQATGGHPRLDTAMLRTVGGKGRDGFAMALVRQPQTAPMAADPTSLTYLASTPVL